MKRALGEIWVLFLCALKYVSALTMTQSLLNMY